MWLSLFFFVDISLGTRLSIIVMDGDDKQLRSLQDDLVTWVRFINRTRRNVDVFWLDYVGTRVKYSTLQPGDAYDIQTFVTHPWIFLDAETACPLRAEGKEVFHPRPEDPDALGPSENIYIDIPGSIICMIVMLFGFCCYSNGDQHVVDRCVAYHSISRYECYMPSTCFTLTRHIIMTSSCSEYIDLQVQWCPTYTSPMHALTFLCPTRRVLCSNDCVTAISMIVSLACHSNDCVTAIPIIVSLACHSNDCVTAIPMIVSLPFQWLCHWSVVPMIVSLASHSNDCVTAIPMIVSLACHSNDCVTGLAFHWFCHWPGIPMIVSLACHSNDCVTAIPMIVSLACHSNYCVTGLSFQ